MISFDLRSINLFAYITEEDNKYLLEQCVPLARHKGEPFIIFQEDVAGLFIITSGAVEIYPENSPEPAFTLTVGGTFGEMSILESLTASATVRASTSETQVLVLKKKPLLQLLDVNPLLAAQIFRGLAQMLSGRLRATNKIFSQGLQGLYAKTAQHRAGENIDKDQLQSFAKQIARALNSGPPGEGSTRGK